MPSKLTLNINPEIIKHAKLIAAKKGLSLSKMVEEYLNLVIERDEIRISAIDQIHEILKKRITNPSLDRKKVKEETVIDKYTV